ncbi:MAG TPA: ATP-binding protein [Saprospiraceae bacterium]|nr:ATP-binding protein [Saprospiraceae bacterium]
MFKNLSIRQIILLTSVIFFALEIATFFIFYYLGDGFNLSWQMFLFLPIVFILNYFVLRQILEYFIFRKIKIIYKIIGSQKSSLSDSLVDNLKNISLEQLESDVHQNSLEAKKELSQLQELETYRKNFVGNVSHELKTPIFSIQGYLLTLLEGGMYNEKILKQFLERAVANVERLQFIISDLETINKIESGVLNLELSKIELKSLVEDVFSDLKILAKEKRIKLEFKSGADMQIYVNANREGLIRVFSNLIMNSIKYGVENGSTKVAFYPMDDKVLVEVSDNGIGIEQQHLKHIFDRFYRVDSNRSRKEGGSGLGLSIVKHIVEMHKGKITVRSTPNQGSTFGFTLQKRGN